jgi:putative sugar O-methyltransferase
MFSVLDTSNNIMTKPSKYWLELNKMNFVQLKENGYNNFKRTIALNYFTWVRIMPWDSQFRFLYSNMSLKEIFKSVSIAFGMRKNNFFSKFNIIQSYLYNLLTTLEWNYLKSLNLKFNLDNLIEPEIGNPPLIEIDKKRISQDIINSAIEYDPITNSIESNNFPKVVLELGAGYGRNAFIFLKLNPKIKYIIVDIPPALWVAQRYLSECFPDKKVFKFREFQNFSEVESEFHQSDLIFLLSSQIGIIPNSQIDLCINISSFHEMRVEQIDYYFKVFEQLTKPNGYLYFKQWKIGHVLFENTTILEKDYPIPNSYKKIYSREARVQTNFFEALYQKNSL